MEPKVTIYTMSSCIHCQKQREWMNKHTIEYTEKNIEENPNYKIELLEQKVLGVPYTLIKHADGKEDTVSGFNINKLERLL